MKEWRQQRNQLQDKYLPVGYSFNLSQFQKTLAEDTAVIEWYITSTNLETFIITRHNLERVNITNDNQNLDTLSTWADDYINDYYQQTDNWRKQLTQRLQELAKILHLDEILAHLPQACQQLILIPHRYLHLFQLHALPVDLATDGLSMSLTNQSSATSVTKSAAILLDNFPKGVSYAPSCQLLQQAQQRQRQRPNFNNLFPIQNPTKDLTYTDLEVEVITQYFQDVKVLKNTQATLHPETNTSPFQSD